MLRAEIERLLRLLSLAVKACLEGTTLQVENLLLLEHGGSWPLLDMKKPCQQVLSDACGFQAGGTLEERALMLCKTLNIVHCKL